MKYLVFGSLNIDNVYSLNELPEKGEMVRCLNFEKHIGGKGLNQAIALKKAGADVKIAGRVGNDGKMLTDCLTENGVDTSLLAYDEGPTGHCIIEIDKNGKNQMIIFSGANQKITPDYCDRVLEELDEGDLILMQYETSSVEYMAKICRNKGVRVAFNPSPFVPELCSFPYEYVDYLILNDDEGKYITGKEKPEEITEDLLKRLNGGSVILTLGPEGAAYADESGFFTVPAVKVKAVDTTGAGDTFTGYFLKFLFETGDPAFSMKIASKAASIAVTKIGAAQTIPNRDEVN